MIIETLISPGFPSLSPPLIHFTPLNLRGLLPDRNSQSGFFEDLDLGVKKADSGSSVSGGRVGGLARRF